jgi:hypothetical protein
MRESIDAKARRYLGEGRLRLGLVIEDEIQATCSGGDVYELGVEAGTWWCSCPARRGCAHLAALRLVVATSSDAE